MNMNVLLMLMKWLPWVMLLLLIFTWVPWRDLFEKLYGNNPLRAKIYVVHGEQETLCKGKYFCSDSNGTVYRYKIFGVWSSVIVPDKYPFVYLMGSRKIRVHLGKSVASPMGSMPPSSLLVSADTLDAIFQAHMGSDLAKTIFGKAISAVSILVIIGVLAFAGYFMYKQTQPGGMFNQQPAIEQPATPAPAQPGIIPAKRPLE